MKKKKGSLIPRETIAIKEIFGPLFVREFFPIIEETETNKRFHLGSKEYEFLSTLTGHVPLK